MADSLSMALLELLRNADPERRDDFLRHAVERLAQEIVEVEVEQKIGAGRYERTQERTNSRNGSQPRDWDTTAGTAHLRIPKLRHGSSMPVLLEPRRRADRALANVVAEAYVAGVSTRKVDGLVQAMGLEGMDKSTVSRLAGVLDAEVQAFRERPLDRPLSLPMAGRHVPQGAGGRPRGDHGADDRDRRHRPGAAHDPGRGPGV